MTDQPDWEDIREQDETVKERIQDVERQWERFNEGEWVPHDTFQYLVEYGQGQGFHHCFSQAGTGIAAWQHRDHIHIANFEHRTADDGTTAVRKLDDVMLPVTRGITEELTRLLESLAQTDGRTPPDLPDNDEMFR